MSGLDVPSVHLCFDQDTRGNSCLALRFESAHMSDEERVKSFEAMESLVKSIEKKITKLKYCMKPADELIGANQCAEVV